MACSKTSSCLSIAAIAISVISIGFTAYKTSPNVVYNSIMKNLEKKQKKEMEKQQEQANTYIKDNYESIINNQPYFGNKNATKVIVKFSDYNCGYCKNAAKVLDAYVKKHSDIKVVIRELPILGKPSFDAAVIAHYIFDKSPEKFVKFHTQIMTGEGKQSPVDVAVKLGFSKTELENAIKDEKYKDKIGETYNTAQQLGIQGTPAFIVNKKFYAGAMDENYLDKAFGK